MIEEILPAAASCATAFGDLSPEATGGLFPAESAAIARAVPKRRNEFTTARVCARQALAGLGIAPVPLVPGKRGAIAWPDGIVGSMTHCGGFRAAAVARRTDLLSVGIDAEPDEPLPDNVLDVVSLEVERKELAELARTRPGISWDRLMFSAKESVFKAWYPLMRAELDFLEAELRIHPDDGTFTARLLVPGPVVAGVRRDVFEGRWTARHGFVATAVALEVAGG